MKKIGIVTMVGYDNYGNLLQNFAVKTLLEEMGFQGITLNNDVIEDQAARTSQERFWKKFTPNYLKRYLGMKAQQKLGCKNDSDFHMLNMIRLYRQRSEFQRCKEKRFEIFKAFRDTYIPYEPLPLYDKRFPEESYFAFVCGSDVVWHPTYHYNKENDFLGFAQPYKRISLAPSFGVSEIPENRKMAYSSWINGIRYLSVREDAGAKIIEELVGRKAEVLPDPTLVIDAARWKKVSKKPTVAPEKPYVLCYFLGNMSSEYEGWIKQCADFGKLEIVRVLDANDLQYYTVCPFEFLWLINHADAVFTDSFHGIVFSMLFHTPFVAFRRIEEGLRIFSRIESLLRRVNMEHREFGKVKIEEYDQMDFSSIDDVIESMREKEINFLRYSINAIEQWCENHE